MPEIYRFPRQFQSAIGQPEDNLIIQLFEGTILNVAGAGQGTGFLSSWKLIPISSDDIGNDGAFTPYRDAVIEFSALEAITIGNGSTDRIGIYGLLPISPTSGVPGQSKLLGVLGMSLGGTAPQIPIVADGDGNIVGYSQIVCNVGAYAELRVGGVLADVNLATTVTVKARPIIRKDYAG